MAFVRSLPLFALVWILYNVVAVAGSAETLEQTLVGFTLISGASWTINVGELLIIIGLVVLFIEVFKSTRTSTASVLDHIFSTLMFIVFLVQFITVADAGTSVFFILMVMSLMDVIAGFSVTIFTARRDLAVGDNVRL
ncbi:MAG: hypothetical protein MUF66_06220 [Gammaproteobacteria bacterium]|jgi:hypothetical protein|nr:hypothetical protein [Gammaproteobacteria bacterium]